MMKNILLSVLSGALLAITLNVVSSSPVYAGDDDILIVANNGVSDASLSPVDVKALFLKKRSSFKGGDNAVPFNASKGTPLRQAFLKKVLEMEKVDEERYWEDQKVKKGITPPAEITNTMRALGQGGAITYVFRKDFKEGAGKVLASF